MEALPGNGWDNLRNVGMGMVIFRNYSKCLTTEDGKYLIPDNTHAIPVKQSDVGLHSEYFEHWNDYTSTTSSGINIDGSIFNGRLSAESASIKKHQVEDTAITTRTQMRYKFYTIRTQPGIALHPHFKFRLLTIAAHLQCNNTEMARYMADLIVRDYGTHVISSADAGAVLVKIDHVKSSYASSFESNVNKFNLMGSLAFLSFFNMKFSYNENLDGYRDNTAHSEVHTIGGPPYTSNFTLDKWIKGLPNNLVPINRDGDPLNFLITSETLPEIQEPLVNRLHETVSNSVKLYYKHNSRIGCTDVNSKNFDLQAILDDNSCKEHHENFTFGGVYQLCSIKGNF